MTWLEAILFSWASWIAGATALALFRWTRHARSPRSSSETEDSGRDRCHVLLVRPCSGAEPELSARLLSIRQANTTTRISVRFTVEDECDPAWPVLARAAEILDHDGWDARPLVVMCRGPNRKAAQLAAWERDPDFDVLLIVDSDVDLRGFDLDSLVATVLQHDRIALAWAPPVEVGHVRTFGDLCSQAVLTGSLHAFPWLAMLDRSGVTGKVLAVRRSALELVGGFASLSHVLGEDFELGQRLRRAGFVCRVGPSPARASPSGRSLRAVYTRFRRWIVVVRTQRPVAMLGYPLLLAPLPCFVLGLVSSGFSTLAGAALAIVIASRLTLQAAASRRFARRGPLRMVTEVILADVLLMAAWAGACLSRTVDWRGRTLRVTRGGRLRSTGLEEHRGRLGPLGVRQTSTPSG